MPNEFLDFFAGKLQLDEYEELSELVDNGQTVKAKRRFLTLLPTKGCLGFFAFCEVLKEQPGSGWLCDKLCKCI